MLSNSNVVVVRDCPASNHICLEGPLGRLGLNIIKSEIKHGETYSSRFPIWQNCGVDLCCCWDSKRSNIDTGSAGDPSC